MLDSQQIKQDFPFLQQTVHGKPVVFLDTGASAQKPKQVIDTIADAYSQDYANVHRGVYTLSDRATEKYEAVRETVRQFINAGKKEEIIFTKGTTEAINLVANALVGNYLKAGDEIIITQMEHHANIVPWQIIARRFDLKLSYIPVNEIGELKLEALDDLITAKTKLLALTHCSNVLGTINPVKEIVALAHRHDIAVLIDGAQAVIHQQVDVSDLDCDFYVFSAHKLYGPTGVGALYVKSRWYDQMQPYQGGGDMIKRVTMEHTEFADPPYRFEAGTPNIVGVIGLGAAIDYIKNIGIEAIAAHEKKLLEKASAELLKIPGLRILGTSAHKSAIITFVIDGFHANDLGMLLDLSGVCVRTGHHCAQPLLQFYDVPSTVRVSFGIYNTPEDIDVLIKGLNKAMSMLSM
ncbi:MAG: aminotransferase class V-fold PLP-dependent enzyme [Francisellaceae bacterium]